jgi:hypothetical protein
VNTIGKQHFTALFSPAREKAFTPKNIKAGFAASGLFPFNPERVLRDMTKPPTDVGISRVEEVDVGSRPQDIVPQTPVTPVSAEALMSLQNLIIQQDAHALDDTSKRNLQRHVQKFVKAGQTLLVGAALKDDQIRFLTTINDEAKVRRKTKPLILGKAKVMSYEDLEEARVKRAEKDAAKEAKGKGKRSRKRRSATPEVDTATLVKTKRGRKRKSDLPEGDAPEPRIKVPRMSEALLPETTRASVVQTTRMPAVEDDIVPKPWRAPVAHMY